MPSLVDSDILLGFVEEANSYLPTIRQSLQLYAADATQVEALRVAHRQVHTITGAASMVGLSALGDKARDLEEAIDMFLQDSSFHFADDVLRAFLQQLDGIEKELASLQQHGNGPTVNHQDNKQDIFQGNEMNFAAWEQVTPSPATNSIPPPAPPAPPARQFDPELAEIFAEEANEYLEAINANLAILAQDFDNTEVMRETRRYAHTLKGSAAMMGFPELSQLSKRIEETFDRLHEAERGLNPELLELFQNAAGILEKLAHSPNPATLAYELQVLHTQFDFAGEKAAQPEANPVTVDKPSLPEVLTFDIPLPTAGFELVSSPQAKVSLTPSFAPPPTETFAWPVAETIALPPPPAIPELSMADLPPLAEVSFDLSSPAAEQTEEFVIAVADEAEPTVFAAPETPALTQAEEAAITLSEATFDADMLEVFRMEAEEHVQNLSQNLEILAQEPDNREALQEIRRSAHTLKGSAAMVNLEPVTRVAHRMEDLLDRLYENTFTMTPAAFSALLTSTETLDALSRNLPDAELEVQITELEASYDRILAPVVIAPPAEIAAPTETVEVAETPQAKEVSETVATADAPPAEAGFAIVGMPLPLVAEDNAAAEAAHAKRQTGRVIRVPLARLDETVKLVSELLISRSMLEQKLTEMERQVQELRLSTARLQRASHRLEVDYETSTLGGGWFGNAPRRNAAQPPTPAEPLELELPPQNLMAQTGSWNNGEFDELEFDRYTEFHRLSRELAETSGDTEAISQDCTLLLQDLDGLVLRQRRLVNELQERLMHLRMVPLGTLAPRLRRIVQVSASQLGKSAELSIEGEQIEMDTVVLDALADPLLHLLRNAVAHGIEMPEARRAHQKMPTGMIRLKVIQEGTEIIIRATDDGCGLNLHAIRSKALSNGLVSAHDLATMTDEQVSSLIFLPGFTTAEKINQVSGRGVGMDIIQAAVTQLKGVITIDSTPGSGTTFTIRVPVALAVTRALVVRDYGETYALPLNAVTRALTLDKTQTEMRDGQPHLRYEGTAYPLVRLGELLKLGGAPENRSNELPVLLMKSGDYSIALSLDELDESRDLVLKSLGAHLGRVPLLLGATIMGDGNVVPILNPVELVQQVATGTLKLRPVIRPRPAPKRTLTVMMVDDSPSVRRIMSNLIKAQEWLPLSAKDGFDALEILGQAETPPDIILLDMEMPRMDGYELLTALRGQRQWAGIPVVMITSRAGDKHRRKAMELGASDYLIKPYQDEILCATIRRLTHK